jgi:hypothetical protein
MTYNSRFFRLSQAKFPSKNNLPLTSALIRNKLGEFSLQTWLQFWAFVIISSFLIDNILKTGSVAAWKIPTYLSVSSFYVLFTFDVFDKLFLKGNKEDGQLLKLTAFIVTQSS